jgi:predicted NAD/FAD-binding protein
MSFSVSIANGAFEYAGSLPGLFAQPANLLRPAFSDC